MDQPPSYDKASYGAPQQGFAGPGQGFTAPGQGFTSPGQGYAAPGQGYASPGQGYAAPTQSNVHVMMHNPSGSLGKDPVTTTCRNCQANVSNIEVKVKGRIVSKHRQRRSYHPKYLIQFSP